MSDPTHTSAPWTPAIEARLNPIIQRFRAEFSEGKQPRASEYLTQVDESDRSILLRELLKVRWESLTQNGETLSIDQLPAFATFVEDCIASREIDLANCTNADNLFEQFASPADRFPKIPGFEIQKKLGRGGMGVVYQARDLKLNQVVALKMILPGHGLFEETQRQFMQEAREMANLRHPNIVQIYQLGEHSDGIYFSMEYCPGGTLKDRIGGNPQDAATASRWVAELASGVGHAHAQRVVHRDLKPTNALFGADGTLKIADFGLVKRMEEGKDQGTTEDIKGSPSYMAPEQALPGRKQIGPAVDIYALGAILYECLTGRPPFLGAGVLDTLHLISDTEPVSPRQLNPKTPRDLETICLKCLRKEPLQRYQTARELADELDRYQQGRPIRARAVGSLERARKWVRRNPVVTALLALVTLSLTLGTTISYLKYNDAKREAGRAEGQAQQARAEKERANAETRRAQNLLVDMHTAAGLWADERKQPAEAALWFAHAAATATDDEHRTRTNRQRFQNWSRTTPRPLRAVMQPFRETDSTVAGWPGNPLKNAIVQILSHPDREHLLARSGGSRRWTLWNIKEEKRVPLPHEDEDVSAAAWSSAGDQLLLGTMKGRALVLQWPNLRLLQEFQMDGPIAELSVSHDGSRVAVAARNEFRIWDLKSRQFAGDEAPTAKDVLWLVFNRKGTHLAVASTDNSVRVYQLLPAAVKLVAGPLVNAPVVFNAHSHLPPVWVDDDRCLLTCATHDEVAWWNVETGKEVRRLRPNQWSVDAIVPSPDGKYVAVAGWWGCQLYHGSAGLPVGLRMGHNNRIQCVTFSPDSKMLATGSSDQSIKLWAAPEGRNIGPVLQTPNEVQTVHFLGPSFVAGQVDGLIQAWSPALTAPYRDYPLPRNKFTDCSHFVDADENLLMTQDYRLAIRIVDLRTSKPVGSTLEGVGSGCQGAFLPRSSRIAIQDKKTLRLWDWRTGETVWGPIALPAQGCGLAASPDGTLLVSMCSDRGLVIEAGSGKTIKQFVHEGIPELGNATPSVRFSADGKSFITFASWRTVGVWDASTAELRFPYLQHDHTVSDVAFSSDRHCLATSSVDNTARVFDFDSGQELAKLEHPHWVFNVAFDESGGRLLTLSRDGGARVWNWRTGELVCPPTRRVGERKSGLFLPGSQLFAAQAAGVESRIWEAVHGKPVAPAFPLLGDAHEARLVLDGKKMIVFSGDVGLARLFDLEAFSANDFEHLTAKQMSTFAELQATHRIHDNGDDLVRLTTADWLERWQRFRTGCADWPGWPDQSDESSPSDKDSLPSERPSGESFGNLLVNESFEDSGKHWFNRSWRRNQTAAGISSNISRTGAKSMLIRSLASDNAMFFQKVAVKPNTRYQLTAWVRTANVVVADGGASGACLYAGNVTSRLFVGTNNWTFVMLEFDSGDRIEMEVGGRLGNSGNLASGTAWFDDFFLAEPELLPPPRDLNH